MTTLMESGAHISHMRAPAQGTVNVYAQVFKSFQLIDVLDMDGQQLWSTTDLGSSSISTVLVVLICSKCASHQLTKLSAAKRKCYLWPDQTGLS